MVHRQDFIRPLCKGLISLRNSLRVDKFCLEKKWRHDDILIYKNICFLTQCCNEHNGITWRIRFDIPQYSRSRKLLKSGSLVCLTNQKFTFLQYATVAENNDRSLRNGISEIRFIDDIPKTSEILKQRDVILIESQVFFPSYFHTLLSIKCMHNMLINEEHSIPFGTHLLNKRHSLNQEEPDYFESRSFIKEGFDISCLSSGQPVNTIDISNETNWPDAQTLGMDDSQHRALVTSMKSKFALIQGPPGTGKQ
ncbi:unnamed protein product [Mytilus edulis]|uniref:ZNFX1 domain-containing protein n=1 Tax=Mytilus edulis TaxID=6550 RepID=A0A8S3QIV5_MYTED|nr:unnamed protein product [Mytilus edulis]